MTDADPARYTVMGNPVAHSKSPRIHSLFATQTGQKMYYGMTLVPRDGFAEAVQRFREEGGRGANVTVPFKEEAWHLAEHLTPRALRAGAANTLTFSDDGIRGDNTDGIGLLRDLVNNHGLTLAGRRILVLGAGGAVRGVLEPLLEAQPRLLHIANRTAERARQLATDFADMGAVTGSGIDELGEEQFELIINGTSASLGGEVPALPDHILAPDGRTCDMVYGDKPTAFMDWAREHGDPAALDGLGMLVEQAAESFCIWRGVMPDTAPVIAALRGRK